MGKNEHTKTFKIIGNNESQFLLDDKVSWKKIVFFLKNIFIFSRHFILNISGVKEPPVKFMIDLHDQLLLILFVDEAVCIYRSFLLKINSFLLALLFITGRNKKFRNDILFGETKDAGLISLTINALYNSIGEHRAIKYVSLFVVCIL